MSECELPDYYFLKERTARKEHKCCECSAPIVVGEKHLVINASWEGRPDRYRQHILCEQACELVRDSGINSDECLYYGELMEFWGNLKYEGAPAAAERPARLKLWRLMIQIKRRERKSIAKVAA